DADFACEGASDDFIDFIHRRTENEEIYFLVNRNDRPASVRVSFRVGGGQAVRWDPVTGEAFGLPGFRGVRGRTGGVLEFLPFQSMFIVFPRTAMKGVRKGVKPGKEVLVLHGPWTVRFDEQWGGPASAIFDELTDWTLRPEEGIRYYSGAAVYSKRFDFGQDGRGHVGRLLLHLGVVKNIASVRLNGKDLGVVWTEPWAVEVTGALREMDNLLEITVVNLWPNRLIGDAGLPEEGRVTRTNIGVYKKDSPLLASGLLGPVTIQASI
ncbi:MAG: glycosylhydrolase-like jelly roll fold domain-containing protein, partial [Bacteroidota bacterium]